MEVGDVRVKSVAAIVIVRTLWWQYNSGEVAETGMPELSGELEIAIASERFRLKWEHLNLHWEDATIRLNGIEELRFRPYKEPKEPKTVEETGGWLCSYFIIAVGENGRDRNRIEIAYRAKDGADLVYRMQKAREELTCEVSLTPSHAAGLIAFCRQHGEKLE